MKELPHRITLVILCFPLLATLLITLNTTFQQGWQAGKTAFLITFVVSGGFAALGLVPYHLFKRWLKKDAKKADEEVKAFYQKQS